MKRKPLPAFGQLLRAHRVRLGLTMNDIARPASLDQGTVSKIERGILRAPRLPRVRLIAKALGLSPDSPQWKQLVEAAWRDRYDEEYGSGISEILTVLPSGRSAGMSGLPPQTAQPGITLPPTVEISFPDIPAEPARPLIDLRGPAATTPTTDILSLSDWLAGAKTMLTAGGCRVTEFSQRGVTITMVVRLPSGADYRIKARITPLPSPDKPNTT